MSNFACNPTLPDRTLVEAKRWANRLRFAVMLLVFCARALPAQLMPAGASIGLRLPTYCGALGRVLLSGLPAPDLDAYLAVTPPLAVTDHTATDPAASRRAIQAKAADGFCFVD